LEATVSLINEIDGYRDRNYWPRRWNCRPYFRDCQFAPLCTSPTTDSIEPLIERMYKVEIWDPLTERS
jgi:hypothetical protein